MGRVRGLSARYVNSRWLVFKYVRAHWDIAHAHKFKDEHERDINNFHLSCFHKFHFMLVTCQCTRITLLFWYSDTPSFLWSLLVLMPLAKVFLHFKLVTWFLQLLKLFIRICALMVVLPNNTKKNTKFLKSNFSYVCDTQNVKWFVCEVFCLHVTRIWTFFECVSFWHCWPCGYSVVKVGTFCNSIK